MDRVLAPFPVMIEGEPCSGGGALLAIYGQITPCLDRLADR
jgi:hypothetical protein